MERKDALTKRPLDFDREEEARKFETTKWLENHFGSDSQSSRGSTDGDLDRHQFEQEPTKKSYFNVTIKSGSNNAPTPPPVKSVAPKPHTNGYNGYAQNKAPQKLVSPAKVHIPERGEPRGKIPPPPPMKYFQGVSNWADRKETPRLFSNKAFHDELKGTVERKKLNKAGTNYVIPRDEEEPSDDSLKHYPTRESDLGYNSGSRNDLRPQQGRKIPYQEEEFYNPPPSKYHQSSAANRGSSYDVRKVSREDLRFRSTSNLLNSRDDREDSAYISGSTHFTSPHSPKMAQKPMMTSNGYRHHTPVESRPVAPQRKRVMERKMKMTSAEIPRPDYSPRSRSQSPISIKTASTTNLHHPRDISYQPAGYNTLQTPGSKKSRHSRTTRFSSEQPVPAPDYAAATTTDRKKKLSIGQSIRKFVGKIRSASSDRKSKSKSGSPPVVVAAHMKNGVKSEAATYQPYNSNIDNHINDDPDDDEELNDTNNHHHQQRQPPRHQSAPPPPTQHKKLTMTMSADAAAAVAAGGRSTKHQPSTLNSHVEAVNGGGGRTGDLYSSSAYHSDNYDSSGGGGGGMNGPKQRFYLGEDPYKGSIYGRENKYDINSIRIANQQRLAAGGGGGLRKINSPDDDIYNTR